MGITFAFTNNLVPLLSVPVARQGMVMLLYLGPETIMPLASILAAIMGFLLIFWRLILKGLKKLFALLTKPFKKEGPLPQPDDSEKIAG